MKINEYIEESVEKCVDIEIYYYKFNNGTAHSDNLGGTELEAKDIPLDFNLDNMDVFEMDEEDYNSIILSNSCERANYAEWYDNADAKVLVILLHKEAYQRITANRNW